MAERATPFIHIADPTGEAIREASLARVALLGTMPAMRSAELAKRYAERFGVEVVVPGDPDKVIVDRIIFDELVRRNLRAESKAEYLRIVDTLRRAGAQGVILGCTEISLLIGQVDFPGFPVFDTTSLAQKRLEEEKYPEWFRSHAIAREKQSKVFWFFSSEKNAPSCRRQFKLHSIFHRARLDQSRAHPAG